MFKKESYDSYQKLLISNAKKVFKIYGDLDDNVNKYEKYYLKENNFEFAIVYYDLGIPPQILFLKKNSIIYIGFEKYLISVNCKNYTDKFNRKLIAPFYKFLELEKNILAICELDVFSFNLNGDLIWSKNLSDVVENYYIIDNEILKLLCFDGMIFKFLISSGRDIF